MNELAVPLSAGLLVLFAGVAVEAFGLPFAKASLLAWVLLYTRMLPREIRQRRLEEIQSDLYEQLKAAQVEGYGPKAVALQIGLRLLLGIPSDIAWSIHHAQRFSTKPFAGWLAIVASGAARVLEAIAVTLVDSISALVAWLTDLRGHRKRRTVQLGHALIASDIVLSALLAGTDDRVIDQSQFGPLISDLLRSFCQLVAYRLDIGDKAATFLVRVGERPQAGLSVYAQFNHPDFETFHFVGTNLNTENSLAGQAIRERHIVNIRDCLKVPDDRQWARVGGPPRFRGRVAVPVRGIVDGHPVEIGALCFDTRVPWSPGREDQELLALFAQKIAYLWLLLSELRTG